MSIKDKKFVFGMISICFLLVYMALNFSPETMQATEIDTGVSTEEIEVDTEDTTEKEENTELATEETEAEPEVIAVTDIEIASHEDKVKVGETITLSTKILPSDAMEQKARFASSNPEVATVNSSGEVDGIKKGNVIIYVSCGDVVKEVPLTVVVATKKIELNTEYLVLKEGESYSIVAKVTPVEAPQGLSYKSCDKNIASVSANGVIVANGMGSTSIIVSNGDMHKSITVIVNKTEHSDNGDVEDVTENVESTLSIPEVVNASEYKIIGTELLKHLYENKKDLQIQGTGYSILIKGTNIVNIENPFITDINLSADQLNQGVAFNINQGQVLCGNLSLSFDEISGKYLYLYNESKEQYEQLQVYNLKEIEISQPGKYLFTELPLKAENTIWLVMLVVSGIIVLVGIGAYIAVKKKYWFW